MLWFGHLLALLDLFVAFPRESGEMDIIHHNLFVTLGAKAEYILVKREGSKTIMFHLDL